MTPDKELSEDQRKVLGTIEKLLRLADRQANSNPEEAASAASKAQELLLAHNLSADMVGKDSEGGQREEQKVKGGFYEYQRDIWGAVAELNFCFYFSSGRWVEKEVNARDRWSGERYVRTDSKWEKCHRLIGRRHNVAATKAMATYLEQAVERLVEERIKGQNNLRFSRWAVSFREGAVEDIVNRIWERRHEMLREEVAREREAARRAAEAGMSGASSGTAVTIASLALSEHEANVDFLMKEPGYSARVRAERAEKARKAAEADAAWARWAQENPEEARREEAKRRAEAEKTDRRRGGGGAGPAPKERDWGAYRAGNAAGAKVGLDVQAGGRKTSGMLS